MLHDKSPPKILCKFIAQNFTIKKKQMKNITLTIAFLLFLNICFAQLEKNTWIIGGSGNMSFSNYTYSLGTYYSESKGFDLKLSPNVGYFVADKFAVGLKPFVSWYKTDVTTPGGLTANEARKGIGPFIRYYFLDKEKQFNIVADATYQFGFYTSKPQKGNSSIFSFAVGPVIYFNTSVGLEFLIGYNSTKEDINLAGPKTTKKKC
jgi:hypothetical protein